MTEPMKTTAAADRVAEATANQKAYDEAVAKMTDRNLFDRVRAAHPHANTGPDALKAMVEDYDRLKGEAETAKGGA